MKTVINWFVDNIVAANLFMVMIIISGYFALPKILMEIFPAPVLDIISISIPYPGASPEDIEKSICTKVEENIAGIESVKKIRSTSLENQGLIYVELLPGEEISKAKEEITTNINSITTKNFIVGQAIGGKGKIFAKEKIRKVFSYLGV